MLNKLIFINNFCIKNFILLDDEEKKIILNMRNNENIKKYMYNKFTINMEEHIKFIESLKKNYSNLYFVVKEKYDKITGVISFNNIDDNRKTTTIGLYKNPFENKKTGKYLIYFIKKIAFEKLNLKQITAEVLDYNKLAINFYKKHGFIYSHSEKKYNKYINDYENIEIFTFEKESFQDEF